MRKDISGIAEDILAAHGTGRSGLSREEVAVRLEKWGQNALPEPKPPALYVIFIRQFLNPLIYILLIAAVVSLLLGDEMDALFIGIVLLVNGIIGAAQEFSASRSIVALRSLEVARAIVVREGREQEINARELVPGDLIRLDAGSRVPADIRLVESHSLEVDESALTGESRAIEKRADYESAQEAVITERLEMLFAGTVVNRGRATGVVIATGLKTELGQIAEEIQKRSAAKAPLLIRMERFTRKIAIAMLGAVVVLALAGAMRGMGIHDIFMMSVGLAVAAIPEGLPIAISVALAIGMRRMAKRQVIVRHMPAVESLGSCTLIALDKTGTLTMNRLSVTDIALPDRDCFTCSNKESEAEWRKWCGELDTLLRAATLANEAKTMDQRGGLHLVGDTVDIALFEFARSAGTEAEEIRDQYPLVDSIPYEPEQKYAASFHRDGEKVFAVVKGAPSTLRAMCSTMQTREGPVALDSELLDRQKRDLAEQGLRVLAFAAGYIEPAEDGSYGPEQLKSLTFLGYTGMQDPIRPEVPEAIKACRAAGIKVVMITGDDGRTAAAIARQAGLDVDAADVVTGPQMRQAESEGEEALDALTRRAHIYARVEPAQKLAIVNSLARNGHFVAVTGDGVNDAPALRHAHVGVAMGKKGTDVARDSSDIILTDDNFASIVAGIQEGRVAYANIRKVVFLLISTGAAEVVLFLLAMAFGTPVPLLAVQLLWLNLVTNGIQDVALATERAEGDELLYPPRKPKEPLFNKVMLSRVLHSTLVIGVGGFSVFYWLLQAGFAEEEARNLLLLLMVLFENFQALNARSEHRSVFRHSLFANPFLIFSIVAAQLLHIAAMYIPGLSSVLRMQPVSITSWFMLLLVASSLLIMLELEKWWGRRRGRARI